MNLCKNFISVWKKLWRGCKYHKNKLPNSYFCTVTLIVLAVMAKFLSGAMCAFPSNKLNESKILAYLDPGTGSLIIQAIIAGLVGFGFFIKIYWHKIAEVLKKFFTRKNDT